MTWTDYQQWVRARCTLPHTLTVEGCLLALEGEKYELQAALSTVVALELDARKRTLDGRPQRPERLEAARQAVQDEQGDVLFYMALLRLLEGDALEPPPNYPDLEAVMARNVAKLTARDQSEERMSMLSLAPGPRCALCHQRLPEGARIP